MKKLSSLLVLGVLASVLLTGCSSEPASEPVPAGSAPAGTSSTKTGAPTRSSAPTPGGVATPEQAAARAGSSLK